MADSGWNNATLVDVFLGGLSTRIKHQLISLDLGPVTSAPSPTPPDNASTEPMQLGRTRLSAEERHVPPSGEALPLLQRARPHPDHLPSEDLGLIGERQSLGESYHQPHTCSLSDLDCVFIHCRCLSLLGRDAGLRGGWQLHGLQAR